MILVILVSAFHSLSLSCHSSFLSWISIMTSLRLILAVVERNCLGWIDPIGTWQTSLPSFLLYQPILLFQLLKYEWVYLSNFRSQQPCFEFSWPDQHISKWKESLRGYQLLVRLRRSLKFWSFHPMHFVKYESNMSLCKEQWCSFLFPWLYRQELRWPNREQKEIC